MKLTEKDNTISDIKQNDRNKWTIIVLCKYFMIKVWTFEKVVQTREQTTWTYIREHVEKVNTSQTCVLVTQYLPGKHNNVRSSSPVQKKKTNKRLV